MYDSLIFSNCVINKKIVVKTLALDISEGLPRYTWTYSRMFSKVESVNLLQNYVNRVETNICQLADHA